VSLREDTLPVSQDGEEEMALITCIGCGDTKRVRVQYASTGNLADDVLRGTLTCTHKVRPNRPCNTVTVFEVARDAVTFYPGRLFQDDLHLNIAQDAREMLSEALLCFYGNSYRGVVVFCRSAAEEALVSQDVPGLSLTAKIENAGDYLTAEEHALANAARIIGRNAIHRLAIVSTANALAGCGRMGFCGQNG